MYQVLIYIVTDTGTLFKQNSKQCTRKTMHIRNSEAKKFNEKKEQNHTQF